MLKYYLIPLETTTSPYDGEPDTHPKYVINMPINWTSMFHKNHAVVTVNTNVDKDKYHEELIKKPDVIEISDGRTHKKRVEKILNASIEGDDIVEHVGRILKPDFVKERDLHVPKD